MTSRSFADVTGSRVLPRKFLVMSELSEDSLCINWCVPTSDNLVLSVFSSS